MKNKKFFEKPELDVIKLTGIDVIATSDEEYDGDNDNNNTPNLPIKI